MPGLAAGPKIFDSIKLPKEKFELHYLEWIIPESMDETLKHYSKRLIHNIKHAHPVLLGVSFGGIIVQEMNKYLDSKKVIIVSSIKENSEVPRLFKFLNVTKIYKLFPAKKIADTGDFTIIGINKSLRKKIKLYNKYLNVRDEKYLKWAIRSLLHWKAEYPIKNIVHIHGNEDEIFPIKYINNCITIDKGTHVMILTEGKKISSILEDIF
jgi:hypothetical protein